METSLRTNPKVVTLASRLSVTRVTVLGALCHAWMLADEHADEDGAIPHLDLDGLDTLVEVPGMGKAMVDVGWLTVTDKGLEFPNYLEHNGSTAKERAQAQKRQTKKRASRKTVTPVTQDRDESVTREEKRRIESTNNNTREGLPCIDGYPTKSQAIAVAGNQMIPEHVAVSWWLSRDGQGWQGKNGHPMPPEAWQSNLKAFSEIWKTNEARDKSKPKRGTIAANNPDEVVYDPPGTMRPAKYP